MKDEIKIEDLLDKDCNAVIKRRIVCFEKRGKEYFIYLMVEGYDVEPEDQFKSAIFRDKLPLYVIPESKLDEHIDLFNQMFNYISFIDKYAEMVEE
jgi:hypothetical protein